MGSSTIATALFGPLGGVFNQNILKKPAAAPSTPATPALGDTNKQAALDQSAAASGPMDITNTGGSQGILTSNAGLAKKSVLGA